MTRKSGLSNEAATVAGVITVLSLLCIIKGILGLIAHFAN
jgi:hypothetical protein